MEIITAETAAANSRAAHALQLAREIERVLQEIQADLDVAEAKLARNREGNARQGERAFATT